MAAPIHASPETYLHQLEERAHSDNIFVAAGPQMIEKVDDDVALLLGRVQPIDQHGLGLAVRERHCRPALRQKLILEVSRHVVSCARTQESIAW